MSEMKLNNVLPPNQVNTNGYGLQGSTIYTLVDKVSAALASPAGSFQPNVETQLGVLRDMLRNVEMAKSASDNDTNKLIRQMLEVMLVDWSYDEKLNTLNTCLRTSYATSTVDAIPTAGVISTLTDVVRVLMDYCQNKKYGVFKDNDINYFKQAYNDFIEEGHGDLDKIVNGDFKSLWKMYKTMRDQLNQQKTRIL